MWGTVLKRDLLGETREEDKFRSREQLSEYIKSEIKRQGTNVVIKNLDVSLIEDLRYIFNIDMPDVVTLDISGWNASSAKYVCSMFLHCTHLKSVDLSGWKTPCVKNMCGMFCGCLSLESAKMSGWDTSNVTDMSYVFNNCESLKSLDLSGWDVSSVTALFGMFKNCKSLESLDLSGWDTSNAEDMSQMFYQCPAPYEVVDNKIIKK